MAGTVATTVVGIYLLGMLGVGVYAGRLTKRTPSDYYLADRTLGTVVLAFTLMATVLSSFTFFGVGAAASGTGFGIYSFLGLAAPFYALLFVVVGAPLYRIGRSQNILTPPEYVRKRYESDAVSATYVLVAGVFLIAFVATQIIGGGVALETLIGVPYPVAIGLIAALMAIYIHLAGMRGVVWSDLIQGLILFAVMLGMFLYVNATVGADEVVGRVVADHPEIFTLRGPAGVWTPEYVLSFTAFFAVGITAYPQLIQRYFAAKSSAVLERSAYLYGAILIPIDILAVTLGIWSLGFVSNPPRPDYVIPLLIETLTNPIVFGIAMSAGVAALMSTADSQLLTLSSMASRDIYREYVDPDISDEQEVRVTQIFLVIGVLAATLLAYVRPSGIFQLGSLAIAGFASTAPAVFLGIYWRGGSEIGALASLVVGAVTMFGFFFGVIPEWLKFGLHYGFVGVLAAFVVFVGVSLLTPKPSAATVEAYS